MYVTCNLLLITVYIMHTDTKVYKRTDRAENPLFAYVNPVVLQKPTFKSFIALLDNYESSTGNIMYTVNDFHSTCTSL